MRGKKAFRLKIMTSGKSQSIERPLASIKPVRTKPTAAEIVREVKGAPGVEAILSRFPDADTVTPWLKQVAFFSVRKRTGIARRLDFWDCDHLDFFSDVQRAITDDRAWFSHAGFANLNSAQTATGRVNCAFNATAAGAYSCVVKLLSQPASTTATVECLIDDSSFGPLSFSGLKVQPHFTILSRGNHHFRIRQRQGAFFFLSLTVFRFV